MNGIHETNAHVLVSVIAKGSPTPRENKSFELSFIYSELEQEEVHSRK
jgi:hypothetical protein